MKNILIVGKKDYVLAIDFNEIGDSNPNCVFFDQSRLPVSADNIGSTALNSLYTLCIQLDKIKSIKETSGLKDMYYIIIPDTLHKDIVKESYKEWAMNKLYRNGKEIENIKLQLWTRFLELYSELFTNIIFKPLSKYNISNPKYNVDLILYIHKIIQLSWETISKHEYEKLEKEMDEILF